jgi:hypothetical protein
MADQWTSQHDWLMQFAISLMTEPGWSEDPYITEILYGQGGTPSNPTGGILDEINQASGTLGQVPKLDANGQPELDAQGNPVMITVQDQMQNLFSEYAQAQKKGDLTTRQQLETLTGMTVDPTTGEWTNRPAGYGDVSQAFTDQMGNLMTQTGVGAGNDTLATQMNQQQSAINDAWQMAQSNAANLVNQLGNVAKQDVQDVYSQQGAQLEQALQDRGLSNTSLYQAGMAGLSDREAAEMQRVNETITAQQLGVNQAYDPSRMAAMQGGLQNTLNLGQLGLGYGLQGSQNQMQLGLYPLQTIADMQVSYPTLADLGNVAMQLGRGTQSQFALPTYGNNTTFGGTGGPSPVPPGVS